MKHTPLNTLVNMYAQWYFIICYAGVLFSNTTADNAVYCIIGYPSVQYTTLHYG